jgi:hypothetical protein
MLNTLSNPNQSVCACQLRLTQQLNGRIITTTGCNEFFQFVNNRMLLYVGHGLQANTANHV